MADRKLDEPAVKAIIERLEKRYDFSMADGGDGLHKHIKDYVHPHFYRRPSVTPVPPAPWSNHGVQWMGIARKHIELKARLTENEFAVDLDPVRPNADTKEAAEFGQNYFMDLFNQLENALGYSIQSALADGLIDGAGVLHWYLTPYDKMPDYEDELDDLGEPPDDPNELRKYQAKAKRYTEDNYPEELGRKKSKKYRETDEAYLERVGDARSQVPVWQVEVIGLEKIYPEWDRSPVSQFKRVLFSRKVDVSTWFDQRKAHGGFELDEETLRLAGDVPVDQVMSDAITASEGWGKSVTLKQLWDREYCYELVEDAAIPEKLRFQCYKHPYGMPNFALNPGAVIRNDEPRLMYQSPYELMFQLKPAIDRWRTLSMILVESQSIPRFILVNTKTGAPMLNEKGDALLVLSADAAASMSLPEGYDLKQFGGNGVNSDFAGVMDWLNQWVEEAAPATGKSTFGASTQPWSARIEQAQNNMEPKMYLTFLANALKVMVQNMVDTMAKPESEGGPGKVWFSRGKGQIQSIDPEQWKGLRVEINIDPVSQAEKGAKVDSAMVMLKEKLITPEDFYGDMGMGLPNPQKKWAETLATWSFVDGPLAGILRKEQALVLGAKYAFTPAGPDGVSQFMDGTGSVVSAGQVAAGGGAPQGARDVTPGLPGQMSALPDLNVPGSEGTMNPLGGMQ